MSPVGFRLFFFVVVDDGPSGGVDDEDARGRESRGLCLAGTTAVQRVGVVVSVIVF